MDTSQYLLGAAVAAGSVAVVVLSAVENIGEVMAVQFAPSALKAWKLLMPLCQMQCIEPCVEHVIARRGEAQLWRPAWHCWLLAPLALWLAGTVDGKNKAAW